MSPSEFDLRDALRDGEGDGVNADLIIMRAQDRIARRRGRLLSTAAAVVIVAGSGVGIGFISSSSGNKEANSSSLDVDGGLSADGSMHAAIPQAPKAGRPAIAVPTASRSAALSERAASAAVACPKTLPQYVLPGGGSPGQFGAGGPLFRTAVSSVVVCGYGAPDTSALQPTASRPGRLVLTGQDAARLVTSLADARKTPVSHYCQAIRTVNALALIGVAPDGTRAGTATATLNDAACDVQVTNGTAIRYNWNPPTDLRKRLLALQPH